MRQVVLQPHRDRRRAAQLVRIRNVEPVVAQHPQQGFGRARGRDGVAVARDRMGDRVGGLDIHGHELDGRIHALGGEQAPRQGVVEGLVQLGIDQAVQQRGVGLAYVQPQRAGAHVLACAAAQGIHGLGDAVVIQADAFDGVLPGTGPVTRFKAQPRPLRDGRKARVVVLEAIADQQRQRCGQRTGIRSIGGSHSSHRRDQRSPYDSRRCLG